MDVKQLHCSSCGSPESVAILVQEVGLPSIVYTRCTRCGTLIGRFVLSSHYLHEPQPEHFLQAHGLPPEAGQEWLGTFHQTQRECLDGFERVLDFISPDHTPPPA